AQLLPHVTLAIPFVVVIVRVAFTLSFDNLVLSNAVCLRLENCAAVPILMYSSAVGGPAAPDIYAVATLALLVSVTGFAIVLAAVRLMRPRR
ncbi:MAG: hypothetical protein M3O88_10090, partial [Actinomycetota bacterium]|nr:hypothetical protein [Actinomycetota bacterium]